MNKLFSTLVKAFQSIEAPGQQLGCLMNNRCSKPGFNSKVVGGGGAEKQKTNLT